MDPIPSTASSMKRCRAPFRLRVTRNNYAANLGQQKKAARQLGEKIQREVILFQERYLMECFCYKYIVKFGGIHILRTAIDSTKVHIQKWLPREDQNKWFVSFVCLCSTQFVKRRSIMKCRSSILQRLLKVKWPMEGCGSPVVDRLCSLYISSFNLPFGWCLCVKSLIDHPLDAPRNQFNLFGHFSRDIISHFLFLYQASIDHSTGIPTWVNDFVLIDLINEHWNTA